jgi:hypothetical protein
MRAFVLSIALVWGLNTVAQQTEFGHWYEFEMQTKLTKDLDFSTETGLRFGYDGFILQSLYTDLNLTYELNDVMRLEGAYRIGTKYDLDLWSGRQRFAAGFRLKGEVDKWDITWRSRVQAPALGVVSESDDLDFDPTWRNRIQVDKKIIKRTTLAFGVETFHSRYETHLAFTDWRARVKIDRKLDKRLHAGFGIQYERERDDSFPTAEWVVQFSCQWEWKRKKKKEPKDGATP